MKKVQKAKDIYVIENFLSEQECNELITFSEKRGYEDAKASIDGQQKLLTAVRNNQRILYKDDFWASFYWERLMKFEQNPIGNSYPIGLNEMFKFYKYTTEQRFKRHRDGSYIRNEIEFSLQTFMVYLNDDFEGGKTIFGEYEIEPQKGTALVFLHDLKHEGQQVSSGIKYVLRSDIMYRLKEET